MSGPQNRDEEMEVGTPEIESNNLTCDDVLTYLSEYIDKNLDRDLTEEAEEHLATCDNCSIVLDSTQKAIILYRQQQRALTIPQQRHIKLYDQISDVFAQRDNTPK